MKETLHLIQWMKDHPEQVEKPQAQRGRRSIESDPKSYPTDKSFTKLCDLQPETIVHVRCRLREPKEKKEEKTGVVDRLATTFGAYRRDVEMTDDTLGEAQAVRLCLWDQQAHKKHSESLLAHDGPFEILNLIIALDDATKSLLAHSSSMTQFVRCRTSHPSILSKIQTGISEKKGVICKSIETSQMRPDSGNKYGELIVLEDVRVERVDFGQPLGSTSRVRPPFTPLLVESYCRFCQETLPRFNAKVIPNLYMSCPKRQCRIQKKNRKRTTSILTFDEIDSSATEEHDKACLWRYRAVTMRLQGLHDNKLQVFNVTAQDPVIQHVAGNINASLLIDTRSSIPNCLDAKWRVASCLNAIVHPNSRFQATVQMVIGDDSTQNSPTAATVTACTLLSLHAAF